ncbi:hypothetical protein [Methylobacterium sp. A54F]
MIDWTLIAEKAPGTLTGLKDLVVAGAAICTTFFAWKALDKWRTETIGKRRLELAEEVLAAFYQVQATIQDARTAFVDAREMVREEGVPENVVRSAYYAPVRRLRDSYDKIVDLRTKRHRFAAVFGTQATKPWNEIDEVLRDIDNASEALLRLGSEHIPPSDPSAQFYVEQRRILARRSKEDPITPRLTTAVAEIEAICVPIIRASA